MKISIIIPTLNEEEKIGSCLSFLCPLVDNHAEIIVVDSKETSDSTQTIVSTFDVLLLESTISSRAAQMNLGAERAQGDIFCFLHADVIPPKEFLEDISIAVKGNDYGWFSYQFDRKNFFLNINSFFTKRNGLFAGGGDQIQFMKREVFEQLNGFDEKYVLMEDFELTRRLKRTRFKSCIIENNATVSTRKYDKNSYLRVNLVNLYVFVLFLLKRPPARLKSVYARLLK